MFVYGHYIGRNYSHITRLIIKSPDTDVAIISCYHLYNALQMFSELWFYTGTASNARYVPIHKISNNLGPTMCNMLPIFYCLTGCDSTASFFGIGKKRAFTVLKEKKRKTKRKTKRKKKM